MTTNYVLAGFLTIVLFIAVIAVMAVLGRIVNWIIDRDTDDGLYNLLTGITTIISAVVIWFLFDLIGRVVMVAIQ